VLYSLSKITAATGEPLRPGSLNSASSQRSFRYTKTLRFHPLTNGCCESRVRYDERARARTGTDEPLKPLRHSDEMLHVMGEARNELTRVDEEEPEEIEERREEMRKDD
jgi:hypothetical protein